jgi:putative DNA primase/helicase
LPRVEQAREGILDQRPRLLLRAGQGARFEVHIEKGRGIHGADAKPFEARLELRDDKTAWSMKDVEDSARLRVAALRATGMSVREIAEEIGIAKSVVHRMKQKIERAAKEAEAGQGGGG